MPLYQFVFLPSALTGSSRDKRGSCTPLPSSRKRKARCINIKRARLALRAGGVREDRLTFPDCVWAGSFWAGPTPFLTHYLHRGRPSLLGVPSTCSPMPTSLLSLLVHWFKETIVIGRVRRLCSPRLWELSNDGKMGSLLRENTAEE